MPIKVLELHHHGIRIGKTTEEVEQARQFYNEVLGLPSGYRTARYPRYPWLLGVRRRRRPYGTDPFDGRGGKIADGP